MNNSDTLMNPTGGDDGWRADIKPALDNLMGRILERNNVKKAWERVKSNRGAAGIDGMTIGDFPDHAKAHWAEIRTTLEDGTYQPQPGSNTKATRRREKVGYTYCHRPGNPTSHSASVIANI
jgi:RNA-directed DNA polymerase